jgi:hypothetical protein
VEVGKERNRLFFDQMQTDLPSMVGERPNLLHGPARPAEWGRNFVSGRKRMGVMKEGTVKLFGEKTDWFRRPPWPTDWRNRLARGRRRMCITKEGTVRLFSDSGTPHVISQERQHESSERGRGGES